MHPFEVMIKQILLKKEISALDYNNYIVSGIEQGIIKDITPTTLVLESEQIVGAMIQLSDGSKFEINIWEAPEMDRKNNIFKYKSEVKQLDSAYFMGS